MNAMIQTITVPDLPWSAILAVIAFAYGITKTILYLKAKERFVEKEELTKSVAERNVKIGEIEDHLVELITDMKAEFKELRDSLDRHYVRREELNGWGDRVKDAEKRQDMLVTLMEGIRESADRAVQRSENTTIELAAHVRLVDVRLGALPRIEDRLDSLIARNSK